MMDLSSTNFLYTPNFQVQKAVRSSDATSDPSTPAHHLSFRPMATSWFPDARNFEVKNSQFNSIGSASVTINNNSTTNDPVSTVLWPHVAAGAIFDSAARFAAGKCHPGTRKKIIEHILDWINNPDPTKHILWIYGAAGAGKSALAHTMCELLKQLYSDKYGGSFFFASGSTDRGNSLKLFTTLAYQLAINFPSLRAEINNALSFDPSLPTKSMEIQLFSLIVQPLLRCETMLSHLPVLVIDGLDECANDGGTTQSDILALISRYTLEYNISLRFMISSRPEYWIRDAFDTDPLPSITLPISLRDDVDADNDINTYLTDGFEKIRVDNKRFMTSVVPPWPPVKIIRRFVEEASGQYIYAATVLKFVRNISKFNNPQKQLLIITSPGPHRASAYSELDRLYATIVTAHPEWETMKRVLAGLLLNANMTTIKALLGVDPDELVLVLDALSSLIEIARPKPRFEFESDLKDEALLESVFGSLQDGKETILFCHRSFCEFLQDEARSGQFYIDLNSDAVSNDIITGFLDMIHQNLDQNYETEPHLFLNIDFATYHSVMQRTAFLSTRHCSLGVVLPQITRITARLDLYDFGRLTHMHCVFYFMREMDYLLQALEEFFDVDKKLLRWHEDREEPELLMDFRTACQKLQRTVNLAREEALSALALCTDFEVTPALVYLTEYQYDISPPHLDGLSTIAGVDDMISALKQYPYVLPLWYNIERGRWRPYTSRSPFEDKAGPDWRAEGAWRDLRISFTLKSLNSIFTGAEKRSYIVDSDLATVAKFFSSGVVSDIRDKELFQNSNTLAILAMLTDLAAWSHLLQRPPESANHNRSTFIVSTLCWMNRQLTNPQTLALLQNHDNTLEKAMATASNYIFEHGFLRDFTRFYKTGLCAFALGNIETIARSIAIKVRPLPQGFDEEKMEPSAAGEPWYPQGWQKFHEGIFGKVTENMDASVDPIFHPSDWYPHLVSRLLKVLVRFLYGRMHPDFSERYPYEQSFPYLAECLPYANPTPENLDALRAIVYLYPQATPAWNPPEGFWSLVLEFLQKYDRSVLSAEELKLFGKWLDSAEHAYIKTYTV